MDYLDLKHSQLYVRLKVQLADRSALYTEKAGPANLFLTNLFSSTEVTLQNKVSMTCYYNSYSAYIQTLLQNGQDALSGQNDSGLVYRWCRFSNCNEPLTSNSGPYERSKLIAAPKTLDLQGPLFHDLFSMENYLRNQVDLKVKLYRSPVT